MQIGYKLFIHINKSLFHFGFRWTVKGSQDSRRKKMSGFVPLGMTQHSAHVTETALF